MELLILGLDNKLLFENLLVNDMLRQLKTSQYKSLGDKELFHTINEHLSLNIRPILDQTFEGDIWVDNEEKPTICYVYDSRKAHFIFGAVEKNRKMLSEFITTNVVPIAKKSEHGSTLIYRKEWELINEVEKFDFISKGYINDRHLYKLDAIKLNSWKENIPKGFKITEITKDILNLDLKNNSDLIKELKSMWGNIENFFKFGFGTCAIHEDILAGWCLGEYYSQNLEKNQFGIGIETLLEYQQKGLATAMASLLVELGLKNGYTIYWDCYKENISSIRTALKVGFKLVEEYQVLWSTNQKKL
jgi:hypothetical protein